MVYLLLTTSYELMMNILHVNSYYVSRSLYKNMYDYQLSHGHNVSVFVPVKKGRVPEPFERGNYTKLSYDFVEVDRYIFHLKHLKILRDIERTYPQMNFDIIHAHSLFSNGYIAYRIKQKYGIPYIVAVRNTDVNDFFKKLVYLRGLGRRIMQEADKIVFLSDSYKNYVITTYVKSQDRDSISNKSVVIPNGIDSFWLNNLNNNEHLLPLNEIDIISVGTIDKNKNFGTSRKVVERLVSEGIKVRWTIIGKKIDEDELEKIITCNEAKYKPPMSKEDLILEYRKNDIFLLPSISETFGLTYAEALTQGLPIIYTRGQGFDKQFKDGVVGYPVDCFNVIEMCDAIKNIMDDYETIRNRCVDNCRKFDWDAVNEQYIKKYGEVILLRSND